MFLIRRVKLRSLLVGGFLLCALITAFSAGMGILSLWQIQGHMNSTTKDTENNIDRQSVQNRYAITLSGLVADITNAESEEMLIEIQKRFTDFQNEKITQVAAEEGEVLLAVEDLLLHKKKQLQTIDKLTELRKSIDENLGIINKAAMDIADSSEFDSLLIIESALSQIKTKVDFNSNSSANKKESRPEEEDTAKVLDNLSMVTGKAFSNIKSALSVRSSSYELNSLIKDALMAVDPAVASVRQNEINTLLTNSKNELASIPQIEATQEVAKRVGELSGLINGAIEAKKMTLSINQDIVLTSARLADHMKRFNEKTFEAMRTEAQNMKDKAYKALQATGSIVKKWQYIQLIIGFSSFFLALMVGFFMARLIIKPLKSIIEETTKGVSQITSVSKMMAHMSRDVAEGASEQAASLEETTSSLEQMSSMTRQSADHAAKANSLMKETQQVVENANISMEDLRTAMGKINEASDRTARIIKTIDEIAFQTNLLALNAAVEAARAGESGKGFAVVADEVRSLAIRAAKAAQETQQIIEQNLQNIQYGSQLLVTTDKGFKLVSESSSKVGSLLDEIKAASGEQVRGVNQLNQAVTQIDQVVQQNAASSRESASTAKGLLAQANSLQQIIQNLAALEGSTHQANKADVIQEDLMALAKGSERRNQGDTYGEREDILIPNSAI